MPDTEPGRTDQRREHPVLWFAKHPLTSLAIGLLTSIFFYRIGLKEKDPRFATTSPEILLKTGLEDARLKVLWDGQDIKNVVAAKIAIWNAGKEVVAPDDLIPARKIVIVPDRTIRVLGSPSLKTSRPGLVFHSEVVTDAALAREVITLWTEGPEVIEHMDGVLVALLYSGDEQVRFDVPTRVKSVPKGFSREAWALRIGDRVAEVMFLVFSLLIAGVGLRQVSIEINRRRYPQLAQATAAVLVAGIFVVLLMSRVLSSWPQWAS